MREVKFRAWWEGAQKLVYFDSPYIGCDALDKWGIHMPATNGTIYLGESTLDQFTGAKDKTGAEIYDQDIITIPIFEGGQLSGRDTGLVFWDAEELTFNIKFSSNPYDTEHLCNFDESDIEVIGNAHESPEIWDDI